MADSRIDVSPDIEAYFAQAVHAAVRARRVETSDATKQYLACLLGDFARGSGPLGAMDQPLTLLLQDALEKSGAERFEGLRRIGDGVLYGLGFFGNCLSRRGADPEYVMVIGSSAYGHAAAMLRLSGAGAAPDVLRELAARFERFVEVMHEIADGALAASSEGDGSVLKLYERWRETGSERLAGELAQKGLCPMRGQGGVN